MKLGTANILHIVAIAIQMIGPTLPVPEEWKITLTATVAAAQAIIAYIQQKSNPDGSSCNHQYIPEIKDKQ